MHRSAGWISIPVFLLLVLCASVSNGTELDEHLRFLEPLIGQNWEGGYIGEDAPDLVISLRFEAVLEGKAVKYTREAPAADFFSETYFYWSPNRDVVYFLNLNSRGIVGEGVASSQDGYIELRGENHWAEGSMDFKTLLQVEPTGILTDTFTRKRSGEWVQGHYQEFRAKE
jgi:hypothetical protein